MTTADIPDPVAPAAPTPTGGTALEVKGIDNVLFAVGDLQVAIDFYGTDLRLPLAFRLDEPGIALFRLGEEPAGLLVRRDPAAQLRDPAALVTNTGPRLSEKVPSAQTPDQTGSAQGRPRIWLEVADARAAAAALAERGVSPLVEPFRVATGWTVEIADPWGNIVGFTDYTSMPARGRPTSA